MAPAGTSLRQEQRDLTRRRIVDAARRCFYDHGVTETSVEHIARVAGVGRATLYLHFANKDAILLDLVAANLRGVRAIFRQLCALEVVDHAAVRAWLAGYAAAIREHREAMRLFHVGLANDPSARTMIDDHRDAIVDMFVARFLLLDAADPRVRVRLILTLARIDHVASAAAEDQPRFDVEAGFDFAATELAGLLQEGSR